MRFIETKTHGWLDYTVGVFLIALPWLFGFNNKSAETWIPVLLGLSAIVYSLFTEYEMGAYRTISMRIHLLLDMLSGILLAASPWLFGFAEEVYLPHLATGIFEMAASLVTKTEPSGKRIVAKA